MKTQGVVLSLAVTDAARSHDFYREVLGADSVRLDMGIVCIELPGIMLFLAEIADFTKYSREAKRAPLLPVPASDALLSCAIASTEEVDEHPFRGQRPPAAGPLKPTRFRTSAGAGNTWEHSRTPTGTFGSWSATSPMPTAPPTRTFVLFEAGGVAHADAGDDGLAARVVDDGGRLDAAFARSR